VNCLFTFAGSTKTLCTNKREIVHARRRELSKLILVLNVGRFRKCENEAKKAQINKLYSYISIFLEYFCFSQKYTFSFDCNFWCI